MSTDTSAADLLARTASIYGSCSTYQDTGEVTTVFITGRWPWDRRTQRTRFKTAFVRPNRFLFEYREVGVGPESEWHGGVMWMRGPELRNWSTHKLVPDEYKSASDAMGAFAGVSSGASHFIPRMLDSKLGAAGSLPDSPTARVVGNGDLDGVLCTRVEGVRYRGQRVIVWIEDQSGLVRKLETGHNFDESAFNQQAKEIREALAAMDPSDPKRAVMEKAVCHFAERRTPDYRTEATTVWSPVLDRPIDQGVFDFVPPADPGATSGAAW